MKRLFAAIDLPDRLREELTAICNGIEGARWERPENLHLTLRFIGEADDAATANLQAALGKIHASNVQIEIAGVGAFPTAGRARILWVGLAAHPHLASLQKDIDTAVQACGFPREQRTWRPHVTLARFRRPPADDLKQWLMANHAFRLSPFNVSEFHLFESQLNDTGAVHTKLQTVPLK